MNIYKGTEAERNQGDREVWGEVAHVDGREQRGVNLEQGGQSVEGLECHMKC